jgi:hypothetical protein
MARAASEDTTTWDTLEDALAWLGAIFASPDYAREWLFPLIADRRVRHRAADRVPDGFDWKVSVAGSDVSKTEVARGPGAALLDTVTVRGVRVAREDIARECPEYGAASAPSWGTPFAVPRKDGPQVRHAKELMAVVYPGDEWGSMSIKAVRRGCAKEAAAKGWKLPSTDSFSRAMGRR